MTDMYGYEVKFERDCVDSRNPREQYSSWYKEYKNTFQSISRTREAPDVVSSLVLNAGDACFLVWAEYSDGDSFGNSVRSGVEAFGVFRSYMAANELKDFLEKVDEEQWYEKALELLTSDGQEFSISIPWADYFSELNEVHVTETTVTKIIDTEEDPE